MNISLSAFLLRYGWMAWPSDAAFPAEPNAPFWADLATTWQSDGLKLLERRWQPDLVQLLFSSTPDVAPTDLARLAKGRLQHALRQAGQPTEFSRKVAVRAIGENTRATVEAYIRDQLQHCDLADPCYRELLQRQAFTDPAVRLDEPAETHSGRYWYNLHLVLVTDARWRMGEAEAGRVRTGACAVAAAHGYGLAKLSVMPDHAHLAVRGRPEDSPRIIAETFQVETARQVGMLGFWKATFYVGTFGEYGMGVVRGGK
jgi:REP element-mobilizing transposase RayT